jgi:hypothetical protein
MSRSVWTSRSGPGCPAVPRRRRTGEPQVAHPLTVPPPPNRSPTVTTAPAHRRWVGGRSPGIGCKTPPCPASRPSWNRQLSTTAIQYPCHRSQRRRQHGHRRAVGQHRPNRQLHRSQRDLPGRGEPVGLAGGHHARSVVDEALPQQRRHRLDIARAEQLRHGRRHQALVVGVHHAHGAPPGAGSRAGWWVQPATPTLRWAWTRAKPSPQPAHRRPSKRPPRWLQDGDGWSGARALNPKAHRRRSIVLADRSPSDGWVLEARWIGPGGGRLTERDGQVRRWRWHRRSLTCLGQDARLRP